MNPMYPTYGTFGYNPMMVPQQQQRLAEMEQQYPQFAPQNQNQNMSIGNQNMMNQQPVPLGNIRQNFIKCRAVTSIDEAKASMIDLDGSIHVFTDIGNKKIYTKQINLDGTATLNTYELVSPPEAPMAPAPEPEATIDLSNYVNHEEFETICRSFGRQIADLNEKIRDYEEIIFNETKTEPKAKATTTKGGTKK